MNPLDRNGRAGAKVLLVDDDDSVRALLRIAFSVEEGVGEVREAIDGADAVRICDEFRPDLVILDYWMPKMDGAAAARRIRSLHPTAQIVAFSGVLDNKPEWADGFFTKGRLPAIESLLNFCS